MKRVILIIVIFIVGLAAGGGIGWAIHGNQTKTTTTATTPSSSSSTGSSSDNTGTSSPTTTQTAQCTTSTLSGSLVAAAGGAAAGNRYYTLTLTNKSAANCVINGYPGVSLTDTSGTTVGTAADKDTSVTPSALTLAPNESATATVHTTVSDNYPAGTCKTGATALKVYPPNDTGSLSITNSLITTWCPTFTVSAFAKAA